MVTAIRPPTKGGEEGHSENVELILGSALSSLWRALGVAVFSLTRSLALSRVLSSPLSRFSSTLSSVRQV